MLLILSRQVIVHCTPKVCTLATMVCSTSRIAAAIAASSMGVSASSFLPYSCSKKSLVISLMK